MEIKCNTNFNGCCSNIDGSCVYYGSCRNQVLVETQENVITGENDNEGN